MIRILLADDHQVLLDGFMAILEKETDMEVVATASNGKQVLDYLNNLQVDVALLDINMPALNGVETCKKINANHQNVHVIALSMHKKQSFIKRMIQYGAMGYILKDDPASNIIEGIRKVVGGEKYFSPRIMDLVLSTSPSSAYSKQEISDREVEVLQLISQGLTNQEIASKLFLSHHTTESHRRNLMEKLDARNTAELVRKGLEKGYI